MDKGNSFPQGKEHKCDYDNLILLENILKENIINFRNFLSNFEVSEWLILSDYCIGNKNYPNNTMAYTIIPGNEYLLKYDEIISALPCDLKNCSLLTNRSIDFLKSPLLFTLGFVFRPIINFIETREAAQLHIEEILKGIQSWSNTDVFTDYIKSVKSLYQKSKMKSFNLNLFNQALLAAIFAASIGGYISREKLVKRIVWLPDRDSIHDKWEGFSNYLFVKYLDGFLQQKNITTIEAIQVKDPQIGNKFDPYTRIPDYFAGPIARLKLVGGSFTEPVGKHQQLIKHIFINNPYLVITGINFTSDKISITPYNLFSKN